MVVGGVYLGNERNRAGIVDGEQAVFICVMRFFMLPTNC